MENGIPDEPLYLAAARHLKREDEDIEAFLARNAEATCDSRFPGPGCLHPDELFEYRRTGSLAEDRRQHLETCAACSAMVEATEPSPERVRAFREAVSAVLASSSPEATTKPARTGLWVPAVSVAFAGLLAFVGTTIFWYPALDLARAPKPPIAPASEPRVVMTAQLAAPEIRNRPFVRTAPLTVTASAKDVATTMAATAAVLAHSDLPYVDTPSSPDACQQQGVTYYASLLSGYLKYSKNLKEGEAKDDIVTWFEQYSKTHPPSAGADDVAVKDGANRVGCQPDAPTLKAASAYYASMRLHKFHNLKLPIEVISLNATAYPDVNIKLAKAEDLDSVPPKSAGSILSQKTPSSSR